MMTNYEIKDLQHEDGTYFNLHINLVDFNKK